MTSFLKNISLCFSAGALGGLANALAVWVFGAVGIAAVIGVQVAPELTPPFVYQKIVWGGIWAVLFLIPFANSSPLIKGLVISLAPTLVQLLIVFPLKLSKGMFGLDLGTMTPVLVIIYNAIWGVVASYFLKATSK